MANLKLYKKTYKNVEGFIVTDTEGDEFTYTETDVVPLIAEANGIYKAPAGTLYSPVIANISDPTQTHYDDVELNTWEDLVMIGRSGSAPHYLEIGGTINGTYTVNGTTYDYPWTIVDFRTVELENGSTYDNVPILEAKYTGHASVYSYSGGNITSWGTSYLRQYMTSQTYLNYFSSEMLSNLRPIKITSCTGILGTEETYEYTFDKLWLKSSIEVCPCVDEIDRNASAYEGTQFEYYKQLLGTSAQASDFTNSALIRYDCSSSTTARSYWLRSNKYDRDGTQVSSIYEFNTSGRRSSMNGGNTANKCYILPCCALI